MARRVAAAAAAVLPSARLAAPGDAVGRYVLESLLGAGGMGEVYLARDTSLRRAVALKLLAKRAIAAPDDHGDWKARMVREARAAAALNHPNLVAVYDVGEHEGSPYIVMELVKGRTLRSLVDDRTASLGERVGWLVQAARALAAAHDAGLVHRDIKPENVMVREDGVVKVLDFGIARTSDSPTDASAPTSAGALSAVTAEGAMIGTPRYMAPEQLLGAPIDARADQYAWGLTAYELCSGRVAFDVGDPARLVAAIVSVQPPGLRERNPEVPSAVAAVVDRAIQKDKEARFGSMREVADALASWVSAPTELVPTPRAAAPVVPIVPAAPGVSRRVAWVAGAAIAVVAAAALAVAWSSSRSRSVDARGETSATAPSDSAAAAMASASAAPPLRHLCEHPPEHGPFACKSSRAWCDEREKPMACCAEGLVATGRGSTCACAPGGARAEEAIAAACQAFPADVDERQGVQRVIHENWDAIRGCYERALRNNPKSMGKVSIFFELDPEGRVFAAQVNGTSLPDEEAQTCVVGAFRRFRFAPPSDGSMIIESYPMVFDPGPASSR